MVENIEQFDQKLPYNNGMKGVMYYVFLFAEYQKVSNDTTIFSFFNFWPTD